MHLWHSDKLEKKKETLLEDYRIKVTKEVVDEWFKKYLTAQREICWINLQYRRNRFLNGE